MNRHKKPERTWTDVASQLVETGIVKYAGFRRSHPEDGSRLYLEYDLNPKNENAASEMRVLTGRLKNLIMHNLPEIDMRKDLEQDRPREYFTPYQYSKPSSRKISKSKSKELALYLALQEEDKFEKIVGDAAKARQTYRHNAESQEAERSLLKLIHEELDNHHKRTCHKRK